jgi:hypothetical protein
MSLSSAIRELGAELEHYLSVFNGAANMHAWAAESPQTALQQLRSRLVAAQSVLAALLLADAVSSDSDACACRPRSASQLAQATRRRTRSLRVQCATDSGTDSK